MAGGHRPGAAGRGSGAASHRRRGRFCSPGRPACCPPDPSPSPAAALPSGDRPKAPHLRCCPFPSRLPDPSPCLPAGATSAAGPSLEPSPVRPAPPARGLSVRVPLAPCRGQSCDTERRRRGLCEGALRGGWRSRCRSRRGAAARGAARGALCRSAAPGGLGGAGGGGRCTAAGNGWNLPRRPRERCPPCRCAQSPNGLTGRRRAGPPTGMRSPLPPPVPAQPPPSDTRRAGAEAGRRAAARRGRGSPSRRPKPGM